MNNGDAFGPDATRADITERLVDAAIGMCSCGAKSPETKWHATRCAWRIYMDAHAEIKHLRAQIDHLIADFHNFETMEIAEIIEAAVVAWRARVRAASRAALTRPVANGDAPTPSSGGEG